MLLNNIIFRDMVRILTIGLSPAYRHKIINNQYPTDDTTMVKLHGIYSVRTAVKQPVASQEAPEAVITLGLPNDHRVCGPARVSKHSVSASSAVARCKSPPGKAPPSTMTTDTTLSSLWRKQTPTSRSSRNMISSPTKKMSTTQRTSSWSLPRMSRTI